MNNCKILKNCLLCNGDLRQIHYFGKTPLANEFVDKPQQQETFPLNLVQCINCNHVQIDCIVDQEILYRNYLYVSGTSKINEKHFKDYAEEVWYRFFNKRDHYSEDFILDIGSNDGTFLKNFDEKIRRIGVDPAINLAEEATKNGIFTIPVFFNEKTAENYIKKIIEERCPPFVPIKVITCNNMFAHNENLASIVNGVKYLLDDKGTFIFENSYLLDMVDNTIFDVIYHEHMHHHHLTPLIKFFDKLNMKIYDVERLPNHGGSIRVYACKKEANFSITDKVYELLELEASINTKLINFSKKISTLKEELMTKLKNLKSQGKSIAIYGVPAKATTLMYALGIDEKMIDFAVDDAPLKQGTYTPGKHIPVLPTSAIYEKKPDVLLVLAWNFADSIIKNHPNFKGTWIIPIPELKVV